MEKLCIGHKNTDTSLIQIMYPKDTLRQGYIYSELHLVPLYTLFPVEIEK